MVSWIKNIEICVDLAADTVEETDGKKGREKESWNTNHQGNDHLNCCGIPRAKLCSYQVYMKTQAENCDENIEVGEGFGESEMAIVTLAIADRTNMEMREHTGD